jgi:Ser/Thr protein kinase RdoA (MazF antagonist)
MLFRWVKGQFEDALTPEHLQAVGRFTAALHKHAETFRWPEELDPITGMAQIAGQVIPRATLKAHYSEDETDLLLSTIPVIQRALRSLGEGHDVAGVIHGDLQQRNILFQDDIACAIDFECVHWNYYAYDIATTFSTLDGRPDLEDLKAAYVDGYTAIRPLPCVLDAHIPAFDMLRAFTMVARILNTPRLKTEEWALGILESAARKANRLLGSE